MGFNLSQYETVKSRKLRFKGDYPNYSIETEMLTSMEEAFERGCLFIARIWKDHSQRVKGEPPNSTGHSLSLKGGRRADATSWIENCEESSIGRALDNLGYVGDRKLCSREEIRQLKHNQTILNKQKPKPVLSTAFNDSSPANEATAIALNKLLSEIFPREKLNERERAALKLPDGLSRGQATYIGVLLKSRTITPSGEVFTLPEGGKVSSEIVLKRIIQKLNSVPANV